MNAEDYSRYLVDKPIEEKEPGVGLTISTYMSQEQVPESEYTIKLVWITQQPPGAIVEEHTHTEDEIILLWGNNHEYPQVLGGEVEIDIGGQKIEFNTTAGITNLDHGFFILTVRSYY